VEKLEYKYLPAKTGIYDALNVIVTLLLLTHEKAPTANADGAISLEKGD
jgi:hypothetical protein